MAKRQVVGWVVLLAVSLAAGAHSLTQTTKGLPEAMVSPNGGYFSAQSLFNEGPGLAPSYMGGYGANGFMASNGQVTSQPQTGPAK